MLECITHVRKLADDLVCIDRKLDFIERRISDMSDALDDYDDVLDDDVDPDGIDSDEAEHTKLIVHDTFDALRNCIIDVEQKITELRAKLGATDGKAVA